MTCLAGVAWYELATQVLIPHFSARGTFNYWTFTQLGKDLPDALAHILRRPWKPFEIAFSNQEKVQTLVYLFLPFLGLTLCSGLAILAIPLLAERLLSTNPQFWGTAYHYSMALAPVLAMGAAAGLANLARLAGPQRGGAITTVGAGRYSSPASSSVHWPYARLRTSMPLTGPSMTTPPTPHPCAGRWPAFRRRHR